jgi:DNA ligase-1
MIKKGSSLYEPGKRSRNWLKYKNIQKDSMEDTIDLVILGYKLAKGNKKSRQKIGSLLVGHYNRKEDRFESVAQVGSGGDANLWTYLENILNPFIISDIPSNVFINKKHMPDVLINPTVIISIKADCVTTSKEHTSGVSIRFPRLISIRQDKNKFQTHIPGIQ